MRVDQNVGKKTPKGVEGREAWYNVNCSIYTCSVEEEVVEDAEDTEEEVVQVVEEQETSVKKKKKKDKKKHVKEETTFWRRAMHQHTAVAVCLFLIINILLTWAEIPYFILLCMLEINR